MQYWASIIFGILLLVGCFSPAKKDYSRPLAPGQVALRKVTDPSKVPDFRSAFHQRNEVLAAIEQSLQYLMKPSSKNYFPYLDITHNQAKNTLSMLKEIFAKAASPDELNREIQSRFDVYESVGWDGSGTVLFTGYCEPIYDGSLARTEEYRYPLYCLPPDLFKDKDGTCLGRVTPDGKLVPYYTRREIEEKELLKGLELVYLRDPLEAYIVHIQGSARIRLPDGREVRIGYAGKTDQPYKSLGEALVRSGCISTSELSLASIKRYFKKHPEKLKDYLYLNENYIFFTERDGGPYGSLNVPLTPLASLATDKTVFPRACPAFVVTLIPDQLNFAGFLMDQDTGGAIRSAGRADIYFGSGLENEERAGGTYSEGRLYYIFARPTLEQS